MDGETPASRAPAGGIGRLALRPGRALARSLLDRPVEEYGDEAMERVALHVLASPAFERILREAVASPVAREVARDVAYEVVRSSEFQRTIEDVLAGPLRRAVGGQTRTFGEEVAARLRAGAARLDGRIERAAHRLVGRAEASEAQAYGGLSARGAALAVDAALTQISVLVTGALLGLVGSLLGIAAPGWLVAVIAGSGWTIVVGGYAVLFWSTVGQTPGMRLLGVRVVDARGLPPTVSRAILRFAATLVAAAPLFLGFLPVLLDRRRRALQDYLARTVVVRDGYAAEFVEPSVAVVRASSAASTS